jgi:hypothetical protein
MATDARGVRPLEFANVSSQPTQRLTIRQHTFDVNATSNLNHLLISGRRS